MEKKPAPKGPRKRHDTDFKKRVLQNWKASGRTAAQIAAEFGVSTFTLYSWRKLEHQGPPGGLDAASAAARIAELEHELAVAREQRDILKKSLGILCEPPRKSMPAFKR